VQRLTSAEAATLTPVAWGKPSFFATGFDKLLAAVNTVSDKASWVQRLEQEAMYRCL
jgi:hypothetical protein